MVYSCGMKKPALSFSLILLLLGLFFLSLSLFAEAIGLDRNPGVWSRARIAVFIVGGSFIFLAYLHYQFNSQIHEAASRVRSAIQKHPIAVWLWKAKAIQLLFRLLDGYFFKIFLPVAILIFYAWLASSGTWTIWESSTYYYSNLAESFINGRLHLSIEPDPNLLALENPYDPSTRTEVKFPVDFSLYKGRFYIYWGPVPAILLALFQSSFHTQVGDSVITFVFICGIFLIQAFLLHALWNHYFSTLPKWTNNLFILLAGLTGPILLLRHNYDGAKIYEAAIAGGQFFLMSGFLFAFNALTKSSKSGWKLFTAGVLWVMAIGTRHSLAVPIGFTTMLTVILLIKTNTDSTKKILQLTSLGLPLVVGTLCLGWYNWARFGVVTETGFSYALAGVDIQKYSTDVFSQAYVTQNLYNYILNPPGLTSRFPFISMLNGSEIPFWYIYTVPNFYNAQPVTGFLYTFPFSVFTLMSLFILIARLFNGSLVQNIMDAEKHKVINWITFCMGGTFLTAFCLLLFFFWAGMRYQGDFIPSLTILSILGYWQGHQFFTHRHTANNFYILCGIFLAVLSILAHILLAISTNSKLINLIIRNFPFL